MNDSQKQTLVSEAKGLAKWFSISLSIKVLGVTVFSVEWPPKSN